MFDSPWPASVLQAAALCSTSFGQRECGRAPPPLPQTLLRHCATARLGHTIHYCWQSSTPRPAGALLLLTPRMTEEDITTDWVAGTVSNTHKRSAQLARSPA